MLDFDFVEWDDANAGHVADNGVTTDEVEDVLYNPASRRAVSRSTGRPLLIGRTATGRTIVVVYERTRDGGHVIVRPVTAYEPEDWTDG